MTNVAVSSNKFAAFLFDLEGTLVGYDKEFEVMWTGKLLREWGEKTGDPELRNYSEDDVRYYLSHSFTRRNELLLSWGYPSVETYMQQWMTSEALAAKAKYLYCYEDIHILKSIHVHGYKLGLLTSSPVSTLAQGLQLIEAELGHNPFSVVVCAHAGSGIKMKPDAEGLNICLDKMGMEACQSNYTGNEDVDIFAAQNAGLWSFLVKRHDRPTQSKPSVIINTLRLLQPWL
jgi:phosphoglycolate phosphatase-like HAD superfamily hydrolase